MKLSEHQIQAVIDWMNKWEQLKGTAIPMRFKEDFSKTKRPMKPSLKEWLRDQMNQYQITKNHKVK